MRAWARGMSMDLGLHSNSRWLEGVEVEPPVAGHVLKGKRIPVKSIDGDAESEVICKSKRLDAGEAKFFSGSRPSPTARRRSSSAAG